MTSPYFTRLLAGCVVSCAICLAGAGRAEDAVARFAKTEFGIDLARYKLGAVVTNFPESIQGDAAANGVSPWRKLPIQRPTPYGTNVAAFAELRFVDDRLVEVQTYVGDFSNISPPGADNTRRLEGLRQLGAQPASANSSAFYVDAEPWRIRVEGFCSATNPILLRFSLSAPKRGDIR